MLGSAPLGSLPFAAVGGASTTAHVPVVPFAHQPLAPYQSRSNSTFTKPTGTVSGTRLIIAMFAAQAGATAPTITAPTGFTADSGNPHSSYYDGAFTGGLYIFWRDCNGSEGASFATTHSAASTIGDIIACSGADPTKPPLIGANNNASAGSDGNLASAFAVSPTTIGALGLNLLFAWSSTTGAVPSTGYSTFYNSNSAFYLASKTYNVAGSTGVPTVSLPGQTISDQWGNNLIAIEAATPGSGGVLAATETADNASLAGTVGTSGPLSSSETADTAAIAGNIKTSGTLAASETPDSLALAGAVKSSGILAASESPDVLAFNSVYAEITGTLGATETSDTVSLAGSIRDSGTLAASELPDTLAIAGQTVMPPVSLINGQTVVVELELKVVSIPTEDRMIVLEDDGRRNLFVEAR